MPGRAACRQPGIAATSRLQSRREQLAAWPAAVLLQVRERAKKAQPVVRQAKILLDEERAGPDGVPRSKGIGFVEFGEHEHALCALRQLNNNPDAFSKVGGTHRRTLKCTCPPSLLSGCWPMQLPCVHCRSDQAGRQAERADFAPVCRTSGPLSSLRWRMSRPSSSVKPSWQRLSSSSRPGRQVQQTRAMSTARAPSSSGSNVEPVPSSRCRRSSRMARAATSRKRPNPSASSARR